MKRLIFALLALSFLAGCSKSSASLDSESSKVKDSSLSLSSVQGAEMKITYQVVIGNSTYELDLADSKTVKAFKDLLPLTVQMNELNGNEKYCYLNTSIKQNEAKVPESIQEGDLMLFSDNCLVLFYQGFKTTYSYVYLGRLLNPTGLAEQVGSGDVNISFNKK
ncbi:MAG: cyclophilin-like fold protein [Bacilli bacterium]|jgi:hypothetical protein|nr:cyclophilin-like fold protein [Bacilli bacterium]